MIDTIIISGGNIQNGFALDFLKKIQEERKGKKLVLMAAERKSLLLLQIRGWNGL